MADVMLIAARAREIYDRQAKERMVEGGKAAGKGRPKQGQESFPDPNGQARDQVGKAFGVSGRMVDYATAAT